MNTEHPRVEIEVSVSGNDWALSEGNFQVALAHALERETKSRWRVVCANILVECNEPYRTLVLQREVLETLRSQQFLFRQQTEMDARTYPGVFPVKAELHTPLINDVQARLVFERSARFLLAT